MSPVVHTKITTRVRLQSRTSPTAVFYPLLFSQPTSSISRQKHQKYMPSRETSHV